MSLENIKILWRNFFGKSDERDKNIPYDKIFDDEDNPIKANNDDNNPGKVVLNGGDHGVIFGLNRKIVGSIIGILILSVSLMYFYNIQNQKAREAQAKEESKFSTTDTAATISQGEKKLGYEDVYNADKKGVAGANSRFNNRKNDVKTNDKGKDPFESDNAKNNDSQNNINNANEANAAYVAPMTVTPAVVPPIPQYYATSQVANTRQKSQEDIEAERAENERKKNLTDRYKSSISFSVGGNSNINSIQSDKGSTVSNSDGKNIVTLSSGNNSSFPSTPIQYMAASEGVLQAGTLIPAMLFSGINTNVAGQVTAQTLTNVYDTATKSNLLIPAGSQLIGSYEASASQGNNRVNVTFTTLVLPDGSSYAIDNSMIAVDGEGYNGIAGKLDHHTDKALRDGLLNSAFTALSSKWANRVYLDMSSITDIKKMDGVKPTITINPGKEFNLFVTKPIIFSM